MPDGSSKIGHNSETIFADLEERVNEFRRGAETWVNTEIADEATAQKLTDFLTGARLVQKDVDAQRKSEKEPHDKAAKAVQAKFKPLLTIAEQTVSAAKSKLGEFMAWKQEQQRLAQIEAARIAREAEEAARKKQAEAEKANDHVGAAAATEALEQAEQDAASAAAPAKTSVRSDSGAGRTVALRTRRFAQVDNANLLVAHYRNHPRVLALVRQIADQEILAAKGEPISIPGVTIVEKKVAA